MRVRVRVRPPLKRQSLRLPREPRVAVSVRAWRSVRTKAARRRTQVKTLKTKVAEAELWIRHLEYKLRHAGIEP